MQVELTKVIKITIMWATAVFVVFSFFSSGLLAKNLFKLDSSFFLGPSLSMVIILFSSSIASIVIESNSQRTIATKRLRILALSVFVFLLSKNAVDNALAILSPDFVSLFYVSFCLAGGLLALSLGSLFGLLQDIRYPMISNMSKWIAEGLIRNFVLGFFLAAYLRFVRLPMIELDPNVAIAEWVVTALAMALIYVNVKMVFERLHLDLENMDWRKHVQEIERETGVDFEHLTFIQEQFVNQGIKEPLLVYLTLHLSDLGKTEQQIMRTTAPLLYYRDRKPRIFAFPPVKKSFERINKEIRKKILEDLMAEIER